MKKHVKSSKWLSRKITATCFILIFLFSGSAWAVNSTAAQTVTATFRDVTLNDVIWELQKQTDFTFIYSTNDVKQVRVHDVSAVKEEVTLILDKCLANSGLTYTIHNGVVAIRKAEREATPVAPRQKVLITGQVSDSSGDPMPGVNVLVKGTQQGAITDINGHFSIDALSDQQVTLQISFIGFETQEVKVVPGRSIRVVMKDDTNVLEEVVVTGYGTFKKSAFAGSASTIKMQEKEDVPAVDFKSLLQGSAAGVQVSETSGALGGTSSITIRGMGSINASTSPLYVIDGVPVMTSISSSIDGGTDIMATLSTSDIENITVIKDAAAASLYGSRAANGVIIITTKSGKEGRPTFNLKTDWGYSKYATDYREVMDGPERRETFWEGLYNQAVYKDKKSDAEARAFADEKIDTYAPIPWSGWEDWESALFHSKAPYENYDLSASGGDKKISYFGSLSYNKQDGIVRQQGLERFTGRVNVKYQMSKRLQLGANILYSKLTQFGSSEGGTYTSPIYSTRHKVSASDPIFNEDGTYNKTLLENTKRNPKSQLDFNYKKNEVERSFNTIFANVTLLEGLVFNTTLSLDRTNAHYKSWTDPRSTDGESDNGSFSANMYQYKQTVWKNVLTYDTRIGEKHNLDLLGGYETHEYKRNYLSGSVKDFPTVEKHQISNGGNISGLSGYDGTGWRLISYLGRLNYNYDSKYYFGASARVDGSSRLHRDSRWGTFWSVSGAWRISSEKFMKPIEHILSDARLRVSYGSNGTLPSDYYGYMNLVSFGYKYMEKPGMLESQLGNTDLKWEKNYNLNIGFDFRLFNRVGGTIEVYDRKTSDLLMEMPLSRTTGFSTIWDNVGRMNNRGIEVELNADIIRTKNFSWNSSINLSHNKNKIVSLGGQEEIIGSYTIRKVGQPYYRYYVKEFAGINPDNGYPTYYCNGQGGVDRDEEGNRITTENSSEAADVIFKGPDPKLTGGWANSFKYRWFDLNFNWTFSLGGYSYDNGASKLEHAGKSEKGAIQTLYRDRWRKPGDKTNIEMFMVGNSYDMSSVYNSRRIHSSDHLRLKNLTFGITLPKQLVQKAYLQNVRFYFSGSNLLTFAEYDRYDPEIPMNGIYYFEAPKMKTYTFGIDIKF